MGFNINHSLRKEHHPGLRMLNKGKIVGDSCSAQFSLLNSSFTFSFILIKGYAYFSFILDFYIFLFICFLYTSIACFASKL